ncbi:MAG: CHAP domain-containing protein [Candidatus Parcubacteria bacterium]|nr:CHAP domain-containing protein [Candidatus Parcubacteria bacterium]
MPSVSAIFNTDLKKDAQGPDVERLQKLLAMDKNIYPEGLVTGFYGNKTVAAIIRFQIKYGVIANVSSAGAGQCGPKTRAKIKEIFSAPVVTLIVNFTPSALGFIIGEPNFVDNPRTIKLRSAINDEFGLGKAGDYLNCTEYAMYRVNEKTGVKISWPADRPRHGGRWADIFQKNGMYKILSEPKVNCSMSLTAGLTNNALGHVALVEIVMPDGSIKISETNWPNQGKYNERLLSKSDWQNKYKAKFVNFS